jgi:hypothetical protein
MEIFNKKDYKNHLHELICISDKFIQEISNYLKILESKPKPTSHIKLPY